MMASRPEEQDTSSDDEGVRTHRAKRRKGPKACDVCRRKKIRCDPDPSGDSQRPCVNCSVFKTECTFTYIAKKRRTQQAYIDGLQNRLSKVEKLLTSLAPDIDLSKELDDGTEISRLLSSSLGDSSAKGQLRPPSPPKQVPRPPLPTLNPGQVVAAFTEWRENKSSDEDDEEDNLSFIPLPACPDPVISGHHARSLPHRFHGKSSGVALIHKVIGMKRDFTEDGVPAPEQFVLPPDPWEAKMHHLLPAINFSFPPADLIEHLIDVFFRHVDPFLPILHRPSFEASVRDGLHTRHSPFGAVLLLLCAAASRWSDDPRVLPQQPSDTEQKPSWTSAGWDFYYQVHARYRRSFLHTTSVLDLQMIALGCVYLQGASNPSPAWQFAGLGLRLALEVGAHRRKRPESGCRLETELWKRAFWSLVVLDRIGSAGLGRPCAIWEEDIDLDLPMEVDDEYMTSEGEFTQPPGKPPRLAYFNSLVKLSQILIGALRTIYPISKSKSLCRIVGPAWEQDMVAALDSSLNSWVGNIPEHLRWDPNREEPDIFWHQSALLNSMYNYVQIIVHRPFITSSRKPSFPSLAICTHAARSCSHILDAQNRRGTLLIPMLNYPAFTAAIVLLFNIWGTNKPGARVDWQSQVQDVHTCMRAIKRTEGRWRHSTKMWGILRDLVCVGDFPLPQGASPPSFQAGHKRARDSDDALDSAASSTPATSRTDDSGGSLPPQSYFFDDASIPSRSEHHEPKREPFGSDVQQPTYLGSSDPSISFIIGDLPQHDQASCVDGTNSQTLQLNVQPGHPYGQPQPELQATDAQSAHHILTALGSDYLVNNTSALGDGVVMDIAQHTLDVWGSAPSGFQQWDEWQQFTNVVQGAPSTANGYSEGGQAGPWPQF